MCERACVRVHAHACACVCVCVCMHVCVLWNKTSKTLTSDKIKQKLYQSHKTVMRVGELKV